jgi:hypothetical protein
MKSLSNKQPAGSNPEFEYAPPWARDRAQAVSLLVERSRNEFATQASRDSLNDRASCQRALESEVVPGPPTTGALNFWPIMRMGIVCTVVAIVVATAVVPLLNPKQNAHEGVQANASPASATSENGALAAAQAVQIVPGLADQRSPVAGTPQSAQYDSPAAIAPPQTMVSTPTTIQSLLNVETSPRPAIIQPVTNVKEPVPQPVGSISAGSDMSAKAQVAAIPERQSEAPPASKQSLPTPTLTLDNNTIQMLIKRGTSLFKDGDFAAARLLFERAANAGSAEAALALGSTYDPSVIKQLGAMSVTPDLDRAVKWYEIATDRGSAEAADRYANLNRARSTGPASP